MAACSSVGLIIGCFSLFVTSAAAVSDTVTVGITITAAASSSSSSSSSGDGGSQNGGAARTNTNMIKRLTSIDLIEIITRRRIPNNKNKADTITFKPRLSRFHSAAITPFIDIPAGAWYEPAVANFLAKGYLKPERLFGGVRLTTRGDLARQLVIMSEQPVPIPTTANFVDVPPGHRNYAFIELAAKNGWLLGDNNCYGTNPCTVRPDSPLTRAEAAAMIVRYLQLKPTGSAHEFFDVPVYAWYRQPVQTAADYCILQGDGYNHAASAERRVNRAETITMLHRASQYLTYGSDCNWPQPPTSASATFHSFTASLISDNSISYTGLGILTPKKLLTILILSIAGMLMGLARLYVLEQKE